MIYERNVIFQNQSNIAQIFDAYHKDYSPKAIKDSIQMPVNAEMKDGILYVPVKYAIMAVRYNYTPPHFIRMKKQKHFIITIKKICD